jgi:CRP-like cAMP-binding protein
MMDIHKESDLLRNVPIFAKLDASKLKLLAFTSQCLSFDDGEAGTLGKNQLFGELAVLTNSPRSATLRAKGELTALKISDDNFLKLLVENPEVALEVMRTLSEKLVLSHHQVEELKGELQKLDTKSSEAPAG